MSGKGFDATNTSANTFNFTQTTGDKVKALTSSSTMTELVLSFTHLAPTNVGVLRATVTVQAQTVLTRVSSCKIVAARPSVDENSTLNLNSDAANLRSKELV